MGTSVGWHFWHMDMKPILLATFLLALPAFAQPVVSPEVGTDARSRIVQRNVDKFGDALLGEVLPQVEKSYRVSTNRQPRAIAGLSMGGTEPLVVGLNHLDRFASVGAELGGGLRRAHERCLKGSSTWRMKVGA